MVKGVGVGGVKKMSKEQTPTPPPPSRDKKQDIQGGWSNIFVRGNAQRQPSRGGKRAYIPGSTALVPAAAATTAASTRDVSGATAPGLNTALGAGLAMRDGMRIGTPLAIAGGQYVPTAAEVLASMSGGSQGSGGGRLDLSAYRAALTDQANQINAQIQAMYRALGEEAAANLGRVQEVYGGAQTGVGDVYNSATQNVQQAFGSAQQQAADQLARLGIEAAAPTVINPMALSQAEAVAGLEQGRAGGQAALGRYGATAKDFASQMAQTAQQQGTEMNAAILASLQNRLMDTLAQEAASAGRGGGGGGGGMSLRDQIAFDEYYRQNFLGEPSPEERQQQAANERWALEQQSQLNYNAAQLAQDFAGPRADPAALQQAYELALGLLTR